LQPAYLVLDLVTLAEHVAILDGVHVAEHVLGTVPGLDEAEAAAVVPAEGGALDPAGVAAAARAAAAAAAARGAAATPGRRAAAPGRGAVYPSPVPWSVAGTAVASGSEKKERTQKCSQGDKVGEWAIGFGQTRQYTFFWTIDIDVKRIQWS
jgi:hypothetical protein